MKIQLTNKTPYRDDDIRAIVQGACRAAGVSLKVLRLTVTNSRTDRVSGYAYYPHLMKRSFTTVNTMRLRIPKPSLTGHMRLARVAVHEAMHLNGATHADMTEEQLNCTMPTPWAEALPLRLKEAAPALDLDPELRKAAARADRLEHAQVMLAKAETRQRRAATILKKWKRRVGALSR